MVGELCEGVVIVAVICKAVAWTVVNYSPCRFDAHRLGAKLTILTTELDRKFALFHLFLFFKLHTLHIYHATL